MQHAHEEVTQRSVPLSVVRHVRAVLEAASGKEDGQIVGVVIVCVAEVAAEEQARIVQQSTPVAFLPLHVRQQVRDARQ